MHGVEGEFKDDLKLEPKFIKVPVVEEQLRVEKEWIETGKVIISKKIVETAQTIDTSTVHEEVEVNRIPMNKNIDAAPPAIRYEGDTTIISVVKEILVVEKRLMLVEEVHITKRKHTTPGEQQETMRIEEITVERIKNEETNQSLPKTDIDN